MLVHPSPRFPLALLALSLWVGCEPADVDAPLTGSTQAIAIGEGAGWPPAKIVRTPAPIWPPTVGLDEAQGRIDLDADQVLGLVPADGVCPKPGAGSGWEGGALFGDESVPPEPPLSGKFCEYHRVDMDKARASTLPSYCPIARGACLSPVAGESWLEPVGQALVSLGLPAEVRRHLADGLRARFKELLSAPSLMPSAGTGQSVLPAPVKVWALDDGGDHGRAVIETIEAAACPAGACGVTVEHTNVFAAGDSTASAVTLARALFDGTRTNPNKNERGLVFNISLGLHAGKLSESPESDPRMNLAYEALKAAINYAGCHGALVVAAIGNRDGGESDRNAGDENAMYPGGWADGKVGWTCAKSPALVSSRPLVLAAGVIDAYGNDSVTTRVNGQAELVLPGYAVTFGPDKRGKLYWEGSSFSSAALSGVLAATWSYMPNADAYPGAGGPRAVVDVLRETAVPLGAGRTTRLCHTGTECSVKQVSLCPAVRAALDETAARFSRADAAAASEAIVCTHPTTNWVSAELADIVRDQLLAAPTFSWKKAQARPSTEQCGHDARWASHLARSATSCPFELYSNGQDTLETLHREPGGHGCPSCSVTILGNDELHFVGALDLDYRNLLTSPVLRLATVRAGTPLAPVPEDVDFAYELAGVLDVAEDEVNVKLDAAISDLTQRVEASLEYSIEGPGGEPQAHRVPIAVVDLR